MPEQDFLDQCQPQPLTAVLGGVKGREQVIIVRGVQTAAIVYHLQQYVTTVFPGPDFDHAALIDGLDGVLENFDQHLFHQLPVNAYLG